MTLSEDLLWRGLIKDKTFVDPSWLNSPKKFYLGIDASSDSLAIGNLAVLLLAKRLINSGWQAVLLAGGATSLIGDPGGKEEERVLKSRDEISKNIEGVKSQIEKILSGQNHELVNNLDWAGDYKYLDFLRDIGKHYSMTELMQRDFVSARMNEGGSGISYAEFSYSLLQGYDFWWLFKNKGVVLQIGASDQWGNMLSGVPLIRKKEGQEVHAFSMPLVINKATGRKFGKSEEGAVWLDAEKTSPTQFYQFWINTADSEVEEYLKVFTFLNKEEIDRIITDHRNNPAQRTAQKKLAEEVTNLTHGNSDTAIDVTKYLIGQASIGSATEQDISAIRKQVPSTTFSVPISATPSTTVSSMVSTGLASSNSNARRLIQSGAVYINGEQIKREELRESDFQKGRLLIRRGKAPKDTGLVELEGYDGGEY